MPPWILEALLLNQLIVIGTSFIAWRSGTFTHRFFNSPRSSVSSGVGWSGWVNLSGKGGFNLRMISSLSSSTSLGGGGGWLSGRTLPNLRLIS